MSRGIEIERDEAGRAARMVLVGYGGEKVSTGRVGPQGAGFTPAERQLSLALGRRESKAQRMLARLKSGPAGTYELMQIGGAGFSSRLRELRNQGWKIRCEQRAEGGAEWSVYTLEGRQ